MSNSSARPCFVGSFYNTLISFCRLYSFCRSYCYFFLTLSRHYHCSILHVVWFYGVFILCYLCRTTALAATVICWLYPTSNKFRRISSSLLRYFNLVIVTYIRVLFCHCCLLHYSDVIMSSMASQITSLMSVYSTVYSGADQRKQQSSASLAIVEGIPRRIPRTKGQ